MESILKEGDRISIYPHFEGIDTSPLKGKKTMKEALLWKKEGEIVICLTCERRCKISEGELGFCKTRKNPKGTLWTLVYGEISSINLNPIEKKPFFHFYPGTFALTVGSWSCNFTCPWCQNYEISKYVYIGKGEYISPQDFIELMKRLNSQGTSISFNEPTLLLEYSIDLFKLAKKNGYYNTFVTNGYMTLDALKALYDAGLDGMNIDIKGNEEIVKKYCGAELNKVWKNAIEAKRMGIWVELTTLLIPGINDSEEDVKEIARRIINELGDETPWHITRYYPAYEFLNKVYIPPTPVKKLEWAVELAMSMGLKYVYLGNVPGHKYENTYCPSCKEALIKRYGFQILENLLKDSPKCPFCSLEMLNFMV